MCPPLSLPLPQALERAAAEGGAMDSYELEGPDRPEMLMDLAEFQLAAVRCVPLYRLMYRVMHR